MAKKRSVTPKKRSTKASATEAQVEQTEAQDMPEEIVATAASTDDPLGFGPPTPVAIPKNGNGHHNGNGSNLMGKPVGLQFGAVPQAAPLEISSKDYSTAPTSAPLAAAPSTTTVPAFTTLKTNMKGSTGEVTLAPLTIIAGENRQGKTALRVAFEMALTGRAPGCVHTGDYLEFAPDGAPMLEVMILSDGASAHYEVADGMRPPEHPDYFGAIKALEDPWARECSLPSSSMKSFLVGDKRARQAIFKRFGGSLLMTGVPMPKGLSTDQQKLWTDTVAELQQEMTDPSDLLAALNGKMRGLKLSVGREVSSMKKQLEELRERASAETAGSEMLPSLEQKYKQQVAFEAMEPTRRSLEIARQTHERFEAEAQQFLAKKDAHDQNLAAFQIAKADKQTDIDLFTAEIAKLQAQVDALAPKLRRVAVLDEILELMISSGTNVFPVLDVAIDAPAARAKIADMLAQRGAENIALQSKIEVYRKGIEGLKGQIADFEYGLQVNDSELQAERMRIKNGAAAADGQINSLLGSIKDSEDTGEPSQAIKAKIDAIHASQGLQTSIEDLETKIRQRSNDQATAKTLENEAEELLQGLLGKTRGTAEETINRYMPDGFKATLDLADGGCEWRIVGSDGRPHNKHSMSGSEKAALLVALALAWTEGAPYRALTLDDEDIGPFHSSPKNLQALLARIQEAVDTGALTQAIVCGVRAEEAPEGWHVVRR